jgi:hypothetical protein
VTFATIAFPSEGEQRQLATILQRARGLVARLQLASIVASSSQKA